MVREARLETKGGEGEIWVVGRGVGGVAAKQKGFLPDSAHLHTGRT